MLKALWADDVGAILTTEYLLLGSIVTLGSAAGLNELRDQTVQECRAFGTDVQAVTQSRKKLPPLDTPQMTPSPAYATGGTP